MSRVLVACEFSGVVRDAFRARGHDAISVDLLPSERPGKHLVANIEDVIRGAFLGLDDFDLMIAHPPCTYLANSGARWLYGGKGDKPDPVRWCQMRDAAYFFRRLWHAPIRHIAVENPIMHRHARSYIGDGPTQTIHPWQFGHGETKATRLWLKNLPKLQPTNIVEGRTARVHREPPSQDRWKNRSRTYQGIADAMAQQFGDYVSSDLRKAATEDSNA